MKVIRFGMNDDCLTNHFSHAESAREKFQIGPSVIGQQRRQIPRMVWMQGSTGIEMGSGIGKAVPLAVCSIVDVKGEES